MSKSKSKKRLRTVAEVCVEARVAGFDYGRYESADVRLGDDPFSMWFAEKPTFSETYECAETLWFVAGIAWCEGLLEGLRQAGKLPA